MKYYYVEQPDEIFLDNDGAPTELLETEFGQILAVNRREVNKKIIWTMKHIFPGYSGRNCIKRIIHMDSKSLYGGHTVVQIHYLTYSMMRNFLSVCMGSDKSRAVHVFRRSETYSKTRENPNHSLLIQGTTPTYLGRKVKFRAPDFTCKCRYDCVSHEVCGHHEQIQPDNWR